MAKKNNNGYLTLKESRKIIKYNIKQMKCLIFVEKISQ